MTEHVPTEIWIVSNLPPPVHGVSIFNEALCGYLDRLHRTYRVFSIGTKGDLADVETFSARKLAMDSLQVMRLFVTGLRAAARSNARPVIYFTPSQRGSAVLRDLAVVSVGRSLGIPVVGHVHGCGWLDEWKKGHWISRLMLATLRQCHRVICLGETHASAMEIATNLPCVGINNGIDLGTGSAPKSISSDQRVELLFLSNLIKSKGLFIAARAVESLRARGLHVRLRCAGSWMNRDEQQEFRREFQRPLDEGTIELVGFADRERKVSLLQTSHFFLLPTTYPLEGQPLSLIEAMAFGCVPITTTQGAIFDLFEFDGAEQLASAEHTHPEAVAESVARLVSAPGLFAVRSQQCIRRYEAALTVDQCASAVLRVLHAARHNAHDAHEPAASV